MRPIAIVAAALLAAGCSGGSHQSRTEVAQGLAALTPVSSCADLELDLRQSALAQMNEQLDAALASALASGGMCPAYDSTAGGGAGTGGVVPGASTSGDGSGAEDAGGASSYSTTNTQVAGVDEADILKNDDRYFYLLAKGELQILSVWPPEDARVLSHTPIEGRPLKLFVEAGRAVVYSSLEPEVEPMARYPYGVGGEACTYGYDCDFTGDGRPAKVTVLDLSDLTHPAPVREIRFSGSFIDARRVGNAVFTVIAAPDVSFPGLSYWPDGVSPCGGAADAEEIRAAFEALRAKNAEIIETAPLLDWLPSASDTVWIDGQPRIRAGAPGDCSGFFTSQVKDGRSFLTLAGFDLTQGDALSLATVVGRPGAVYANGGALYVASRHEQPAGGRWFYEADAAPEATTLHRFELSPGAQASYTGSGVVKGRVLNQFSMDEHEGKLRIATTTGHLPSASVHSTVSVLEQGRGGLDVVGELDGLAPGEDIRAARFQGPRGFLVTFKKTDPLFVLDLSDAASPRVAGELQIPGFSTYLQMMDDAHLLSIGYDADEQGDFAWFAGVELQIFDVSDPASPSLTQRELIGTRGTSSEALTDHLAFNYFAARDLLAIPMVVCEGGSGGSYGDELTFSGLMVYRATAAQGFEYLGGISHPPSEPVSSCSSWWSRAGSPVKRSVVMDDYVFSISEDEVRAAPLAELADGGAAAVVPLVAAP